MENNNGESKEIPEKKPFFKRAADWAQSFLKKDNAPPQAGEASGQVKDRLKDLIDRVGNEEKGGKISFIPESSRNDFQAAVLEMVRAGFNDGVAGRPTPAFTDLALRKAQQFYSDSLAYLNSRLLSLQREIRSRADVVENKMRQSKLHHGYLSYLQHHYKFNERGYTVGEFLLYFILFIIIFLADLPMGIEMIKRFFPVSAADTGLDLHNLGQSWEAVLTAIGIASSSIYIKVWYDEFAGKKYGQSVISGKKFEEMFRDNQVVTGELSDEEKKAILKNARTVRYIKTTILIFTLIVIVILGLFRMYAWEKRENIIDTIPSWILTLTMTSITLLFSFISGVCLSIALSALTNYIRLRSCQKENESLEKGYVAESKELALLQGDEGHINSLITHWGESGKWEENLKGTLASYYEIGFSEGLAEPDYYMRHLDFFEKVVQWRDKAAARKINIDIQNI